MNRLQTVMDVTRAINPHLERTTVRSVNTHYEGWSAPHERRKSIANAVYRTLFTKDSHAKA